ncbi:MAG: hypothetical protein GX284_09565 [Clostridiales bacterium]|nr:hypothetical protein [Clostridiales bacterium]
MSSFVCESIVQSGRTSERLYYTLEDNSFFIRRHIKYYRIRQEMHLFHATNLHGTAR